ncbi:hypothetical protein E2C01_074079 [Portunus trituberculatus]|uniref:Uncharacterized protein n=1 Tax=Portunus trituberculatus TaxID=210409 RepID=A0A5B7ICE8_PORTR|nr:hypothetical protein [Portunus trituberculatus]
MKGLDIIRANWKNNTNVKTNVAIHRLIRLAGEQSAKYRPHDTTQHNTRPSRASPPWSLAAQLAT